MKIAFINLSTLVPPADFSLMVKACAAQSLFDLMPLWNEATVDVTEASTDPGGDAIPVVLFDDADTAGALGYHDKTPDGRPYARVFVRETLDGGGSLWQTPQAVSVTMSHEMCEAIVDPNINLWGDDGTGTLYALEACDAVEGDAYKVDLTEGSPFVSNFVTPAWFDANSPVAQYDKLGFLALPFTLRPGGYTLFLQSGSIQQKFASEAKPRASKSHPAARTFKRFSKFTIRTWERKFQK